jgi:TolB-like protein/cytochrome c-type biogenesis protein CcmH/NrfG
VKFVSNVCEICGSPIETTSAGDLGCIACLIATGLDAEPEQSHIAFASAPDQLGAYTIEYHADGSAWELGHGAMGITYRAIDKALARSVALKIINADGRSRSAEARERFMREARAAAALRHPNVATVYQFGVREATGQFFYAMELVEGETLEERVRRLGPLDVLTTIDIALQVAAALEAAEERGLVHRDLKPGNLMLVEAAPSPLSSSKDNAPGKNATRTSPPPRKSATGTSRLQVKVIDFGVAKAVAEKTNPMALTHGGFVGTPAFASPEQFTNASVDVRSDIYSLGATLWFLLTGYMLFSGRTIEEIQDARRSKPLPVEQLKAARAPHRLILLLTTMLAIEPAARPAGAHELSARLQAVRASITGRGKIAGRLAVAAAIVAVATILAVRVFHPSETKPRPSVIPEKSIAVLPLENLSDDSANAYFAEGIQEQILTRLAKIGGLKVISRASTQRYQGKPRDLGEIAKQLGVANILEGSVQKAADQVRVSVQLINTQTDSHLWAETYDRKLTDILGVESEIAKEIADALRVNLTSREEQALAVKPTNNPEAYDAYLHGLAFDARSRSAAMFPNFQLVQEAIGSYERAVRLDPRFALAWARLSRAEAVLCFNNIDTAPPTRCNAAKTALENAQKLQPESPETLLALGYYQYWVLHDYGLAKKTFASAGKVLPSSSEVPVALGRVTRREGQWDESIAYYEQALALDPRDWSLLMDAAWTYTMVRQFPTALKLYDRVLDMTPKDADVMASKAGIYQAQGKLQEAASLLSEINSQILSEDSFRIKITQWRLDRNYDEAIRELQARQAHFHFGVEYEKLEEQVHLALMQYLAGDTARAKVAAEQAHNALVRLYGNQPEDGFNVELLSQTYAVMGEKELALKEAERARIMTNPGPNDAISGPRSEENLALIQTMVGNNSSAISTLTQVLQTRYNSWLYIPAPVTPAFLRLDPLWDPLRGDPAFHKLCEEKTDKSIAVLPLENLSGDPNNAYFAEGLQEEILTRLAKIRGLKVISRTSTQRYQGKPQNLGEIAKQLGVANILEGSVQRAADQMRVNVQLINAQTDSHLWADTYDRKITDIFGVESEIAKGVAESLQANLSPHEEQALAVKPTKNPEAYEAYLRGLAVDTRGFSRISQRKATAFFERAVQLDPNFALAWARLSRVEARRYFSFDTPPTAHRDAAKRALDNAQRLDPDSTETMLALGYYQYRVLCDYGAATATFKSVRKMLPGSSEVPFALG